ncbi:MSMEG_0570 family nitrogen starvation response protein [Rouxiella sp. WC2420]|uniref:MSMEG_0570 family nitrogen starvation response protein n=1 Tax=Rouxiella sp. WC2420 TaxID=3234145 RepID=A0AB39VVU9_9GAMM
MPAMHFHVCWPDGSTEACYSPSTVIGEYLTAGEIYSLTEFTRRCSSALNEASQRVEQKYGFACSSAMDQLTRINEKSALYQGRQDAKVSVTAIAPVGPLP